MPSLGIRLRELRGDLSLYEIEQSTGIPRSNIKRYEEGVLPKLETLKQLADYYEVSYESLFVLHLEDLYPGEIERSLIIQWAKQQ